MEIVFCCQIFAHILQSCDITNEICKIHHTKYNGTNLTWRCFPRNKSCITSLPCRERWTRRKVDKAVALVNRMCVADHPAGRQLCPGRNNVLCLSDYRTSRNSNLWINIRSRWRYSSDKCRVQLHCQWCRQFFNVLVRHLPACNLSGMQSCVLRQSHWSGLQSVNVSVDIIKHYEYTQANKRIRIVLNICQHVSSPYQLTFAYYKKYKLRCIANSWIHVIK